MDYHQQVLALAAAQSVYDAMEAPEYYEDDEFPSWADGKRLIAQFNAGVAAAKAKEQE